MPPCPAGEWSCTEPRPHRVAAQLQWKTRAKRKSGAARSCDPLGPRERGHGSEKTAQFLPGALSPRLSLIPAGRGTPKMKRAGAAKSPEHLKSSRPYSPGTQLRAVDPSPWSCPRTQGTLSQEPETPRATARVTVTPRRAPTREGSLGPGKARPWQRPRRSPGSSPVTPRLGPGAAPLGSGLDRCP